MENEKTSLSYMMDTFKKAPQIYQASLFWQKLNEMHVEQLQRYGYENFKRTLNLRYFNFLPAPMNVQVMNLVRYWIAHPTFLIFKTRYSDNDISKYRDGIRSSLLRLYVPTLYKLFTSMQWWYTKGVDKENLLGRIEEPLEGNPFRIYHKDRLISQDVCNSILDYYSIMNQMPSSFKDTLSIAELGAGYGRDAFVFLKVMKCKYVIFDIPPALYVAQRYLSSIFPGLRIFKFRDFDSYDDIKPEYEKADLCFFTPNQMELLPKPQFDLFINISSLHEMTMEQIKNYFSLINEYTRGYFYTKQWLRSKNPDDGVIITFNDYPILPSWQRVFFRKHPIQSDFFEALYRIA